MIPGIVAGLAISGAPPVAYTTMNPSDKGPQITLSGDNLVVGAIGSGDGIVRSVASVTGKRYFEAVYTAQSDGTATIAAGIANSAHSLTASLGYANANGWAFWGQTTGARHNGATAVSGTSAAGDVFGFAVDEPGHKLWIRKNGVWIQGDPVTDTSPIWSNLSGTLHAAACPWTPSAIITMRFNPASFSHPAPTGFSPITA